MDKVDLQTIEKLAKDIDRAISTVKICDPAIGSGAFPMGMVYEILRLKQGLPGKRHFDYGEEKFKIIQDSIYGVDIDLGAVDIARLRFWLALIVDEEEPKPMPNLDYKIMQGNSLCEEFEGIPLDNLIEEEEPLVQGEPMLNLGSVLEPPQQSMDLTVTKKNRLKELMAGYYMVDPERKTRIHKLVERTVDNHLKANIARQREYYQQEIRKAEKEIAKLEQLKPEQLKGYSKYKKLKKSLDPLQRNLKEIDGKEKRLLQLEQAIEKPFFLWNLFFGDVLVEKEGFDIVIANPPYGVPVDDETKKAYGLSSKDSYGAFTSMALDKLMKPNPGVHALQAVAK